MEHNTDKERWINEVLGSTEGMKRAQPQAGLYERVSRRLAVYSQQAAAGGLGLPGGNWQLPTARWAAAALLWVVMNAATVIAYNSRQVQTGSHKLPAENSIVTEMESGTTYNY